MRSRPSSSARNPASPPSSCSGRGALGGLLRLGLPPTIGPHLLPFILPKLHRAFSTLKLYVREELARELPDALSRGVHDLLLVPLPVHGADLETQPIFREAIFIAMADDHPRCASVPEARGPPGRGRLTLERGHQLQEQVEALCDELGADLRLDYGGTSLDTLTQMVAMGTGISFLPGLYVERALGRQPGITVREIEGRSLSRTIGAVWRSTSARRDDYLTLVRFVRETVAAEFPGFMLL